MWFALILVSAVIAVMIGNHLEKRKPRKRVAIGGYVKNPQTTTKKRKGNGAEYGAFRAGKNR